MPVIKPFKALMYDRLKIADLEDVVAPPYDVISTRQQEEYYNSSDYNIIRVVLGKTTAKDNEHNNQYTRAKKFLDEWMHKEILKRDKEPSIYIYEQTCKNTRRLSFVSLIKLETLGRSIFPHEETLYGPKVDRLNLLRACRANFSPLFFLYSPASRDINEILKKTLRHEPFVTVELNGIGNRLWKISDHKSIMVFEREMKNRQVFIADGHHRYNVALKYSKEAKDAGYLMGMFVSMEDKGVVVLPTHRLVKTDINLNTPGFMDEAKKYFEIHKFGSLEEMFSRFNPRFFGFGMYFGKNTFYMLRVKNMKYVEKKFESDVPPSWRRLNMVILHHFFFHHIMKLGEIPGKNIKYISNEAEARKLVDNGSYNASFFLNAIKPQVVRDIALSGEKMPHKATYFFPKPLSGLLINKF